VRASEVDEASRTPLTSDRHVLAAAKGGGFLAAGTMFEFASRFVIAFMLARGLGKEDYGAYVLGIAAASLFAGISLLGTDDAMVRYVAILSGRRDQDGVSGTIQVGLSTAVLGGVLLGAILFFAAGPVSTGLFNAPELVPLLRFFAFVVPFLAVSNSLIGIARGFKRMEFEALGENVVQSLVRMGIVAVLFFGGWLHLYGAAIAFGLSDVAASIALVWLLHTEFSIREWARRSARRDLGAIFRFALPLWVSGLLRSFRSNIQNILLGALTTVANVGVFAIAARVNLLATVVSVSIYQAARPLMAQLHDRKDLDDLHDVYGATTRWTLMLNVPFFLAMVLYPQALLHVFGKDFVAGAAALAILAAGQMISAGTGTCQGMLDMTGHTRAKLANTVAMSTVLTVGGFLLIRPWGVTGAAVASMLAVATVNVASVIEVWFFEREQPYDRTFVKPVIAAIVSLLVGFAIRAAIPVGSSFTKSLAQGLVVAAIYVALLLLLGPEQQDRLVARRALAKARRLPARGLGLLHRRPA
jgi:O-antigen/teichoic acid export membrane protein